MWEKKAFNLLSNMANQNEKKKNMSYVPKEIKPFNCYIVNRELAYN